MLDEAAGQLRVQSVMLHGQSLEEVYHEENGPQTDRRCLYNATLQSKARHALLSQREVGAANGSHHTLCAEEGGTITRGHSGGGDECSRFRQELTAQLSYKRATCFFAKSQAADQFPAADKGSAGFAAVSHTLSARPGLELRSA